MDPNQGRPPGRVAETQHWHFVETERAPSDKDKAVLERLLRYGPEPPAASPREDRLFLVVPRLGTLSAASSYDLLWRITPRTVSNVARMSEGRRVHIPNSS